MKKAINTYILPAYLACYLINGDKDNLTKAEIEEIDTFLKRENINVLSCSEDQFFAHRNDMNSIGCDCLEYQCIDR